jgi:site-specific recombinase XerD
MKSKGLRFKVIAQEAVTWYESHDRKDVRNLKSRMSLILESFGEQIADEIKPSEIDTWLGAHDWSPATKNRYKNVFGKTFQVALADGKVTKNPARLVEQRAENNARIRYLLDDEEKALRLVIRKRSPNTWKSSISL